MKVGIAAGITVMLLGTFLVALLDPVENWMQQLVSVTVLFWAGFLIGLFWVWAL